MVLALNNLTKVDMPLNKETKETKSTPGKITELVQLRMITYVFSLFNSKWANNRYNIKYFSF